MIGIIAAVLGLIALIRGEFTLAGRTIPRQKGRVIGSLLIFPVAFEFCYAAFITSTSFDIGADGEVTITQEQLAAVVQQVEGATLIVLIACLAFAAYLIWSQPRDLAGNGMVSGEGARRETTPPAPMDEGDDRRDPFTGRASQPTESRPAHPLEGNTPRGSYREQQRPKPTTQRDHPLGGFTRAPNPAQARQPKSIMNVDEAAAYMKLDREQVIALIDASKLPAARSNGQYAIARIAIDDYLAENPGT